MPDLLHAVALAEGLAPLPGDTEEERLKSYLAMWQDLIDSGAAWELQGAYGRQAVDLIRRGLCRPPPGAKLREGGS